MARQSTLATFAYYNIPRHEPTLTKEQAWSLAEYVIRQSRPAFDGVGQWKGGPKHFLVTDDPQSSFLGINSSSAPQLNICTFTSSMNSSLVQIETGLL